jgi:hypothetical protein
MSLLKIIKKIVYLAPVRCGRTFYAVDIVKSATEISIKFTPTDKFLMLDPRREDEAFMPDHIHLFEKWQHVGLAIGSLCYFLDENYIGYRYSKTDDSAELICDIVEREQYAGIEKQEKLKHAQRTFNPDQEIDAITEAEISSMIDNFLAQRRGYKIMVKDPAVRKKLSALAIYWESIGDINGDVRPPQMVTTPMMISVPPEKYDVQYWFDMGYLYAQIGLKALSSGYLVAYCNAFNLFDPRVSRVEDILHVKFGTYTKQDFVPRPWICIGKALDQTKPYNWIAHENHYVDSLMIDCIMTTKEYVTVIEHA